MIVGPQVVELARPTVVGVRVDVKRGRQYLAFDVPVWDVTLSGTVERVDRHQLQFTAPHDWVPADPLDPLNNYGQRVHIQSVLTILGEEWVIPQGWYRIESWEETDSGVRVTCSDLAREIADNKTVWPRSPKRDATLRSELQELVGGRLTVMLGPGVQNVRVPRSFQYGLDPMENVTDLCAAHGLEWRIGVDGYLHVRHKGIRGIKPVRTYTATDLLRDAPRASVPRRANVFTAVGEGEIQDGHKTKTIVSQKFTNGDSAGWAGVGVTATWDYYNGYSGESARCTWEAAPGGRLAGPMISLQRGSTKGKATTISVRVRASASTQVTVAAMRGTTVVAQTNVAASSWTLATVTVPKGRSFSWIRISQGGEVSATGSLGAKCSISLDNVRVTVGGERTVDIDFEDRSLGGLAANSSDLSFMFRSKGFAGDYLKATWENVGRGREGNARLVWSRNVAEEWREDDLYVGTKRVEVRVASSTSDAVTVAVLDHEQSVVESKSVAGGSSAWRLVTFDVPPETTIGSVRVSQTGLYSRGHWLGVDNFLIRHTFPNMVQRKWSRTVSATAAPFEVGAYGRVVDREELSSDASPEVLRELALTNLHEAVTARGERVLGIDLDPTLELGDVIGVVTDQGEAFKGRVVAYSKPLDSADARMETHVEVLRD